MRFASLFLIVSLAAPAAWSQAAAPAEASERVQNCFESLAAEALGIEALEAQCPGLRQALTDLGYDPFLSDVQLAQLNFSSLASLQEIAQRYRSPPADSRAIEVAALDPILESLERQQQAQRPPTLFERFKNWLRGLLDNRRDASDDWLVRWLDEHRISDEARGIIINTLMVLVVVLALAVLVNELRVAGVFRRWRSKGTASAHSASLVDERQLTLADLDTLDLRDRASLLLRALVSSLIKAGRLRNDRSLTHRELGMRAAFASREERDCFQDVAKLAERAVFGAGELSLQEVEPIVRAGRALNAALNVSSNASPGVQASEVRA